MCCMIRIRDRLCVARCQRLSEEPYGYELIMNGQLVHELVQPTLRTSRSLPHTLAQQAILLTANTLRNRFLFPIAVDRDRSSQTWHHVRCDKSNILGHAGASRVHRIVTRRQSTGVEVVVDAQAAGRGGWSACKAGKSRHTGHAGVAAVHIRTGGINLLSVLHSTDACVVELG